MTEIDIRITGTCGRITLNRPQALNALSYQMVLDIEAALDQWRDDTAVEMLVIDAVGERAFCAGGDIAEMYAAAKSGDFSYGQKFWRDEYRMNAKLAEFPKPVATFLQGFTMGGGVGVGCHGSHRIVAENSQIAMPEVGIGLVPDVGGSYILAQAPGRLGEYLGTTATRMGPADAIYAGFADYFIPKDQWPALILALEDSASLDLIDAAATTPVAGVLHQQQALIDAAFGGETLADIWRALAEDPSVFASEARKSLSRVSPLSAACAVEMTHRLRGTVDIRRALELEYRFTFRALEKSDFIEGIRAAIIDKDRTPVWQHKNATSVPAVAVSSMLLPLGAEKLVFERTDIMKIGFIGLGNMGGPMAENLAKAGHHVKGFDLTAPCPEGVSTSQSAAACAADVDVLITMLPNGAILRSVADEVIPVLPKGAAFLDCSTVDVDSARAVADQANAAGILALDAPVSGGIGGAMAGSLTFMVGGSAAGFAKAKQLFDIMGQKSVHCGPSGNGQAAKICNNMILGATMIATCESIALADKLGLDRQALFDVVSTSSGSSWSMNTYCPAPGIGPKTPADNDYAPGFASDLMLKDLRLSQQAAESVDADTPMGARATELYAQFVENEDGMGRDFSAMLPRFEKCRR